METEHYFVVVARNDGRGWQFSVDDDTLIARFPEGVMYCDGRGWHNGLDSDQKGLDESLADHLMLALDKANDALLHPSHKPTPKG